MKYNLKNPGQYRLPDKESNDTCKEVPPRRAHLPDPNINQVMTDQCLSTTADEQEQSAIDAIIYQIEEINMDMGVTSYELHSPIVGMT